jgi:hypothetical protein
VTEQNVFFEHKAGGVFLFVVMVMVVVVVGIFATGALVFGRVVTVAGQRDFEFFLRGGCWRYFWRAVNVLVQGDHVDRGGATRPLSWGCLHLQPLQALLVCFPLGWRCDLCRVEVFRVQVESVIFIAFFPQNQAPPSLRSVLVFIIVVVVILGGGGRCKACNGPEGDGITAGVGAGGGRV